MKLLNKYLNIMKKLRNKHKIIPLVYTFFVTFTFVLALTQNIGVRASVSKNELIKPVTLEDNIAHQLEDAGSILENSSLNNIKDLFEMVNYTKSEKTITKVIEVAKGDTFTSLLTGMGIGYTEAHQVYQAMKKVYDPARIRIGQKITVFTKINTHDESPISLEGLSIEEQIGVRHVVIKDDKYKFVCNTEKDEFINEVNAASGSIAGTLSNSMNDQGVPNRIVAEFIKIFSYSVDFRRDLHKGDKFEVIYENQLAPDGTIVKTGNILYASLKLRNDKISLYRYEDKSGASDYYNEKGLAMKKFLHRKPLAFQQARISSPFGKRRHPIYRDIRIHWGVDYAAPRGTPVFAAGDGVVLTAKYNGGYGNYIKIRHNSEYSTAYGHLNGYAKGIKPGVRVKQGQTIGYVGNTGKSTGPHLHYEVVHNNKRVNPVTIKAATGKNLEGPNLTAFKKQLAELKQSYGTMFAESDTNKVANK